MNSPMSRTIQVETSLRTIRCHFYSFDGQMRPGILFLPDLAGITPPLKNVAQRISEQGYHVLLPDLYDGGAVNYCMRAAFDAAMRHNEPDCDLVNEIHRLMDALKNISLVHSDRLGVMGMCLTGGFALHMATRDDVKAPIVYHHSLGRTGAGIPPSCLKQIETPVQGHFIKGDIWCSQKKADALEQGLDGQLERYDYRWIPHGIPYFFRTLPEGRLAWKRSMAFLERYLR